MVFVTMAQIGYFLIVLTFLAPPLFSAISDHFSGFDPATKLILLFVGPVLLFTIVAIPINLASLLKQLAEGARR